MTQNYQISSNLTLFYKLFLPIAWVSFFGMFAIALFMYPEDSSFIFRNDFRIGFLILFVVFFILLYFTLFQLKRVEFNPDSWTTTNYVNTYQYNYDDIEKITITNIGIMKLARVHLKNKGSFGKRLPIILNDDVFKLFLTNYPDLLKTKIER